MRAPCPSTLTIPRVGDAEAVTEQRLLAELEAARQRYECTLNGDSIYEKQSAKTAYSEALQAFAGFVFGSVLLIH
jgi:hypothetical protein